MIGNFIFFFQTVLAEQQRDEALSHVKALKEKLEQVNISGNSTANYRASDLRGLPLPKLKNIQVNVSSKTNEGIAVQLTDLILYRRQNCAPKSKR